MEEIIGTESYEGSVRLGYVKVVINETDVVFGNDKQRDMLRSSLACGHVNVLLGSGFSTESVPVLGSRELWFRAVDDKIVAGNEAATIIRNALRAEYFMSIMEPLRCAMPTRNQIDFLITLRNVVRDRGSVTIPQRVNLFTTNYDSMIELALDIEGISFNDGFSGRSDPRFSTESYSRLMLEQSLFMEYSSLVPTLNVLKIHGSLTWREREDGSIGYCKVDDTLEECRRGCDAAFSNALVSEVCEAVRAFRPFEDALGELELIALGLSQSEREALGKFYENYSSLLRIVNPSKNKFEKTVVERSYYDLLRIYANELDRNNALLIVFGFSFADEHILDLTRRAARSNPSLLIIVSCYTKKDAAWYSKLFGGCENVLLIVSDDEEGLDLSTFTRGLQCLVA